MGFSWSLYCCQHANERVASRAPGAGLRQPVTDRGPPIVFHLGHGANSQPLVADVTRSQPREPCSLLQHYIYVDNFG
eukprot:14810524-Heterocapsa_arctica.AAC.1